MPAQILVLPPRRSPSRQSRGDLQPHQRFRERCPGALVINIRFRLREPFLRTPARRFRPLDIYILRAFRKARKDRHPIWKHLGKSIRNREIELLLPLAIPQLSDRQRSQHWRMPGQDAKVSARAGDFNLVHLLLNEQPLGGHDLKIEMCG